MADGDTGDAVTIIDRGRSTLMVLWVCLWAAMPISAYRNTAAWRHGDIGGVAAYLGGCAIALAWGCARAWRMQLRIDEHGVTVRNFLRTHRIGWTEIDRFEDGSRFLNATDGHAWALRVVRRDGRAVRSQMASHPRCRHRELLVEAVRQAAERHGIPADVTGLVMRSGSPAK